MRNPQRSHPRRTKMLMEHGNDDTPDAMRATSPENHHRHPTEAVTGELPFLVTHWLSGYAAPSTHAQQQEQQQPVVSEEEQAAAMQKIQRAASELSSAFATLGAFGSAPRVRVSVVLTCSCWNVSLGAAFLFGFKNSQERIPSACFVPSSFAAGLAVRVSRFCQRNPRTTTTAIRLRIRT